MPSSCSPSPPPRLMPVASSVLSATGSLLAVLLGLLLALVLVPLLATVLFISVALEPRYRQDHVEF